MVLLRQDKPLMLLDHLTDAAYFTGMTPLNSFYASSPTVLLPANPLVQQTPRNGHYADSVNDLDMSDTVPTTANSDVFLMNGSVRPMLDSLAGRKRSRGDIHAPEDDEEDARTSNPVMLLDPAITDSQFDQSAPMAQTQRPAFPSRKSQRKSTLTESCDNLAHLVLPHMRDVTEAPLIDQATRALGISWTRMDSTESLLISQAAYGKWIRNHYPSLKDVTVWFENSAIPGYLVEASNMYRGEREFYIFSDDLTQARQVTNEPAQLIPRLQMLPALHLAAPGGWISAETDPFTAAQNEVDGVQVEMASESN